MIRRIGFLILVTAGIAIIGCEEPPEIRQYRVAKSRSDLGDIGQRPIAIPAVAATATRMVVAIAERSDATWFFKITGSVDGVESSQEQWKDMLSGLKFDDGQKPVWTVPDGWVEGPTQSMRYATLLTNVPGMGQVEMSISSLGPNQDLLSNVNRWRGQLGLEAITADDLNLERLESRSGELKIFDQSGTMSSQPMMARPADGDLEYDIPDGWMRGTTNSIVKVRLAKGSDSNALQITVTQLPADANQWVPNAQRWADQVGLQADDEFVEQNTTDVAVDEMAGRKIRLIPPEESGKIGIVGVMLVRDELAWFFKLIGERDAVEENEKAFEEFLNSFRFK